MTPAQKTQPRFVCEPIRRIGKEKSMARNHEGGIISRRIIEKESLRKNRWKKNHREDITEKESWRRTPGGAIHRRFPPSLSKENNRLISSTIKLLFMEHAKYFQSVSQEGESKVLK
jgi:hypothetical protein